MKFKCKHKDIAEEINSRLGFEDAEFDPLIDSLVHMDAGGNHEFNLAYDVITFLGYEKPVTDGLCFNSGISELTLEPKTMGAYYK
ncbi:hypothetical protein NVP1091O_70 [Vibrio phage 1.091.O._10N.286.52.B12]|nr:hypothetical protein NVP1091O_70 [Vibrio phage 1.091.O._10N.286.52.B12]